MPRNRGPQNSILNDPTPFSLPEIEEQTVAEKVPESDWSKLGKKRKWKQVDDYLEARKEYWRHFLPGGKELKEMALENPERAGVWAAIASVIVDELDTFQFKVQTETGKE